MPITTCVFDAYGTLFDVSAAAREAASEPAFEQIAGTWQTLAMQWRDRQLQYSWLRAVTGEHCDFWQVTQDGLDWALEANGLSGDTALRERLLQLYWELSAYPEVPAMLSALKDAGLTTAILSNGSPAMLDGAVLSAGLGALLDANLSVESVGVFKPSAKAYNLVETELNVAKSDVLFVSSNGWDAGCAASYGFRTVWVNRLGLPVDKLPARPHDVLSDLRALPELVATHA